MFLYTIYYVLCLFISKKNNTFQRLNFLSIWFGFYIIKQSIVCLVILCSYFVDMIEKINYYFKTHPNIDKFTLKMFIQNTYKVYINIYKNIF